MIDNIFESFGAENTQLMNVVNDSVYGRGLNQEIRYWRYCHTPEGVKHRYLDPERKLEVAQLWGEQLLDADVNNLQHLAFTALLNQAMCRFDDVDEDTLFRSNRALLVHDLKEYVFDVDNEDEEGDLTHDEAVRRGYSGFVEEHRELAEMLKDPIFWMLDQEARFDIENIMNDSKRSDPKSAPGKRVEIAERSGYLHSGVNAIDAVSEVRYLVGDTEYAKQQENKLFWMAENIFANHIPRLVNLSSIHPSVNELLLARADIISIGLTAITSSSLIDDIPRLYAADGETDLLGRQQKLISAYNSWDNFVSNRTPKLTVVR